MYEIKVTGLFSSAHNLRNYHGKCEHLHGHNWRVEAVFCYKKVGRNGLAIDFRLAKEALKKVTEGLDHSYLNDIGQFKKMNPTSENIAKFIYAGLRKRIKAVSSVAVWENDSSCAVYRET